MAVRCLLVVQIQSIWRHFKLRPSILAQARVGCTLHLLSYIGLHHVVLILKLDLLLLLKVILEVLALTPTKILLVLTFLQRGLRC